MKLPAYMYIALTYSMSLYVQCAHLSNSAARNQNQEQVNRDLWEAIFANDLATVKKLFAPQDSKNIPNVNAEDPDRKETALMFAAHFNRLPIAEFLIEQGAVVDMPSSEDITPLMLAAQMGSPSVAQLLIAKGANINAQDSHRRTALLYACRNPKTDPTGGGIFVNIYNENSKKEVAIMLILKGADVNAQDKDGSTPLSYAIINSYKGIIDILVKAGARTDIQNVAGKTALGYTVPSNTYVNFSGRLTRGDLEKIIEQAKEAREKHGNLPLAELLKENSDRSFCRVM